MPQGATIKSSKAKGYQARMPIVTFDIRLRYQFAKAAFHIYNLDVQQNAVCTSFKEDLLEEI